MTVGGEFGTVGYSSRVDADTLVERIGLTDDEIEWRKEFIDFTEADVERLRRYEETFTRRGDEIAEMFYENLQQHDQTREIMDRSPRTVEQLKWSQKAYLESLASGEYDQSYFEDRARIGKIHDMLEMPMKHYIGQYGVYYNLILPIIADLIRADITDAIRDAARRQEELSEDDDGESAIVSLLAHGVENEDDDDEDPFEEIIADLEDELTDRIDERIAELHSLLKIINLDMQVATDTYIDSYSDVEEMLERQRHVTNRVSHAMQDITETGESIARSIEDINRSVDEQSRQTQQAAEGMEDISVSIEELATTTEAIAGRDDALLEHVAAGRRRCRQTRTSIEDVREENREAGRTVEQLQDDLGEIDALVGKIDDTAEETKTLAVNANLEAQRSGSDEGFGAVAEQFKQLSEGIKRYTDEIETRVANAQDRGDDVADSLAEGRRRTDDSLAEIADLADDLGEIEDALEEFTSEVQDLSSLVDQQASSTEEIAVVIDAIDDEAQQISEELEAVTAAIEEQFSKVETVESVVTDLAEQGDQRSEAAGQS